MHDWTLKDICCPPWVFALPATPPPTTPPGLPFVWAQRGRPTDHRRVFHAFRKKHTRRSFKVIVCSRRDAIRLRFPYSWSDGAVKNDVGAVTDGQTEGRTEEGLV
ncbi:hypothetical protein L596_001223 [Steinernema carpocapsae]|uniref:Uncharacterized protein n=1 Tax=Steinernema carpocapsae TaxID=34508 RepID=A0A4U8ULN7_STECR|nr:hypothetical protein L596_001223 [Steinernema carpocapsae]